MTQPLTIRAIESSLVVLPMRRPLGTSVARITEAPLLLLDVHTAEGVTGRSYLFCYLEAAGQAAAALARDLSTALAGGPADPASVRARLASRFKLLGMRGLVAAVVAATDVACWDAASRAAGLPLARLLGARPRPVPAYNSNGLGLIGPDAAAEEALSLIDEGFGAVKMRLGRPSAQEDLAAVRAVRTALGPDVAVMADFNQALDPAQARERCRMLDDEGLAWIEEPVRHDDYATSAELTRTLRTPIQLGENFAGPREMAEALRHGAADLMMPDLDRIGGVTGWRDAAALADAAGVPLSCHLYPEVSAQLLAASPTAHWLEYVDWADPILTEPLTILDGQAQPPDRPGNGLEWDNDAVQHYRVT
ncbi:MAG TPA: enolase C-terminal domain-like protein [Kribbella sp.]|nr:enolase C-terminal domain-like protein [Kribbella sp.]